MVAAPNDGNDVVSPIDSTKVPPLAQTAMATRGTLPQCIVVRRSTLNLSRMLPHPIDLTLTVPYNRRPCKDVLVPRWVVN